jgi:signal transduction histidine kinase
MIIQKLGGSISVKSQPGQGSTMVIHLPLKNAPVAPQLPDAGTGTF